VTPVLRDARLTDLPALLDVQHRGALRALTHIFPQDRYPFPRAAVEARWAAEIAAPDVQALVVENDGGTIAGFAAVRDNELLHFGTAVETWGTGFAAAVHQQLLDRIKGTGATAARLRVYEENHRARRFYEKLGWRRTGQVSVSTFPPYSVLLHYERDLIA
jgi:RimJ/RimL family protein N-acetyltransferase